MPHHPAHESAGPVPQGGAAAPLVQFTVGQKVVFFGDSITATTPGFIAVLDLILNGGRRNLSLTLVNAGVDGDNVTDLQRRLDADVLSQQPDWVFILVGTNDLLSDGSAGEFEQGLDSLVSSITTAGARVVLMTLTLVAEQLSEAMGDDIGKRIKEYNTAIKAVAAHYGLPLVDLQRAFLDLYDRAATYKQEVSLSSDGIHPDSKGHALIARAIVSQLGLLAAR